MVLRFYNARFLENVSVPSDERIACDQIERVQSRPLYRPDFIGSTLSLPSSENTDSLLQTVFEEQRIVFTELVTTKGASLWPNRSAGTRWLP